MSETQSSAVGAGGHIARRPYDGPEARRIARVCPTAALVYEGAGVWALCERRRRPRWMGSFVDLGGGAGRLCLIEDAYSLIKRYPRLDGGEIENDVRRLVYTSPEALLDEIDGHNERVKEGRRRDTWREFNARREPVIDACYGRRRFGVSGFGRGFGGAARVVA